MFLKSTDKHFAGMRLWMRLQGLWVAKELFLDAIRQKKSIKCRNSSVCFRHYSESKIFRI